MPTDFESLELRKFGYRLCVFFELHCSNCQADIRIGSEDTTATHLKCPLCGVLRPAQALAKGYTRRSLPFHEIVLLGPRGLSYWLPYWHEARRVRRAAIRC